MKKIIYSLLFMSISVIGFSQTTAEKLFQATLDEYQKNPMKAVMERASEDYVLVSGNGYTVDKAKTVAIFKNVSSVDVSFKDLKVRQFGNTVIATGKEHSVRHHSDGMPDLTTDYLSTYIYEIKGDHLVYLSGQHTIPAQENINDEEENIKKMLSQETKDVYATKDVNGYFVQSPAIFRGWNTRTGYSMEVGYEAIAKKNKESFGTRPREMNPINENFAFKFYGNDACVVIYDQYLYGKEQTPSKELRILEKENGQWKIAGLVALWDYSGNAFEQANVRKTIEAETNAYHAGDAITLDKQWANVNYVERQAEYFKAVAGSKFIKGENLRKFGEAFGKTMKPTGQTYKISDYEAHVGSTTAWVTYSQEVFNADGKSFNKTRETRILERTDGWKIVMMSFVEL